MRTLTLALLALTMGCVTLAGCAQPDFSTCTHGLAWAECGGSSGAPRFACGSSGCFWFANGEVAAGYRATDCPDANLCCHERYPFSAGAERYQAGELIYAVGTGPWSRERERAVSVVIGTPSSGPAFVVCTGAIPPRGVCIGTSSVPMGGLRGLSGGVFTIFVQSPDGFSVLGLAIEVMQDAGGTLAARVCDWPGTDVPGGPCPATRTQSCATSGSIVLSQMPTSLDETQAISLDLDVLLANGGHVTMHL